MSEVVEVIVSLNKVTIHDDVHMVCDKINKIISFFIYPIFLIAGVDRALGYDGFNFKFFCGNMGGDKMRTITVCRGVHGE